MMTGSSGWRSLNLRQKLEAALAGQREVEEHEIESFWLEHAQAFFAVDGGFDGVAFEGEQDLKRLADGGFVVDDRGCGEALPCGDSRWAELGRQSPRQFGLRHGQNS